MSDFNAMWLTHPAHRYSENGLYLFRHTFSLDEAPDTAECHITAEARYKLIVNGERAAFGPCRPSAEERYFDTVDLAPYLRKGKNTIVCRVLCLADKRDMTAPQFLFGVQRTGNLGFAMDMLVALADGSETIVRTDEESGWECAVDTTTEIAMTRWDLSCCTIEEHAHAQNTPEWVNAKALAPVHAKRADAYMYGIVNELFVTPRPIPMLYQKEVPLATTDGKYYIADELTFGFPVLHAAGHGRVRLSYAESFGDGGGKGHRLDRSLPFHGSVDTIDINGDTVFEPFWYHTARIVHVEIEGDVQIESLRFVEVGYPLTVPTDCDFGTEADNALWKISVATLMRCMQESYEDCPFYEQLQYCMDTSLQMLYNYQLTDDDRLARKAIHDFRLSQRADGLLSSRYPTTQEQFIPSFSFYYIFMVAEHYRRFGDLSLVQENLRAMDGVIEWFRGYLDPCGLLTKTMYWDFIDWSTPWGSTQGAPSCGGQKIVAIVSAMYVYVLREAAKLNALCGRDSTADTYRTLADSVADSVQSLCYRADRGLYSDDLRGEYYSQHMQVWCVLAGIAQGEVAQRIMENALELDAKCTFAYAYFWFRALEAVGLYKKSDAMLDRLRALPSLGCTTIPETPDAPRSDCHAWGAIAIYEFAAVVLGVRTVDAAKKRIRIAPRIDGREHACGTVCTGIGKVFVEWTRKNGTFTLHVHASGAGEKEICLPDGLAFTSLEDDITCTCTL